MDLHNSLEILTNVLKRQSFGNDGIVMISGTAAQSVGSGTYYAIQFITTSTLTAFTMSNSTTIACAHKAGTVIYGDILTVTASAGDRYILYKSAAGNQ